MKPDDQLTNDSPIAPPDRLESPREQPIRDIDPHATLEEDDDAFNEFQMPGEHLDLLPPPTPVASAPIGAEPFRPVPGWVIAAGALLLLWAGIYLGTYSGGFQGDVFTAEANYKPAGPTGPVDPIAASKGRGQKLFVANCAQCHQTSGLGVAGQFPPLVGSEWVIGDAPKRLPQILLHGIQGLIHVKGGTYNNAMPAWDAVLKDNQIADILTYVRGELGGNAAGPITTQEMDDARAQTGSRSDPWSEAELEKIPAGPIEGGGAPAAAATTAAGAASSTLDNPPNATGADKPAAAPAGQGPAVSAPTPTP